MKRVLFLGLIFCLSLVLKAQKVYFIYLQSETSAPFYVKMAGKIYSSTTSGYLILSKLVDSTYILSVGQPGKQEEPKFSVTISRGDRGFLIKNVEGKPGLFDLQTMALYNPITAEATTAAQTVVRNDSFTKMLAKAADDTTLLSQPVVQTKPKPREAKAGEAVVREAAATPQAVVPSAPAPEPETKTSQPDLLTVAPDTAAAKETSVATPSENGGQLMKQEQPPATGEDYKKSTIIKKSERANDDGLGLVFLDSFDGRVDTIELTIPNQKSLVMADTTTKQVIENKQFLEISNDKKVAEDSVAANKVEQSAAQVKPKPQCAEFATDDDFFKLRRDMAAGKNDDDMLGQAKKYFRSKCYRTEQIKYLSTLFLTDEGKYHFFDAAYRHVSDQEKFASLQTEIQDSYYINRFKALIGN